MCCVVNILLFVLWALCFVSLFCFDFLETACLRNETYWTRWWLLEDKTWHETSCESCFVNEWYVCIDSKLAFVRWDGQLSRLYSINALIIPPSILLAASFIRREYSNSEVVEIFFQAIETTQKIHYHMHFYHVFHPQKRWNIVTLNLFGISNRVWLRTSYEQKCGPQSLQYCILLNLLIHSNSWILVTQSHTNNPSCASTSEMKWINRFWVCDAEMVLLLTLFCKLFVTL